MRFGLLMLLLVVSLFVIAGCADEDVTPPTQDVVDHTPADNEPADTTPQGDFCDDSDNGLTFFVQGEVVDAQGRYSDYCVNPDVLREYFCKDESMHYEDYECLYGCSGAVCLKDTNGESDTAVDEEPEEIDGVETEDVLCGGRESLPCPEGFACFDHPNAQPEYGFCQEYEVFPEGSDYAGLIKCPPTKVDYEDCPKGLARVCATYFDTVRQRETFKMFDSPCLACSDVNTLAYKFGRC